MSELGTVLRPLEGGHSGRTFLGEVGGERAVVRLYPPGDPRGDAAPEVDQAVLRLVRGLLPVPEVLEDGRSALLVPPGDVTALATAIDRVLGDPKLGAALADEAARFAREQLDPGAASARFKALAGSSAGAGA